MSQFTTMARPYARAAFESALDSGALRAWSAGLSVLSAVMQHEKVAGFMAIPSNSAEKQARALLNICGDELDSKLQNLVRLLAGNKRLALLPEISELFEALKAESEKSIDVEVISAFDLDAAAETKLAEALKVRLQREVKLSSKVDTSLIGGMIVRAGDLVIDGSVRGKLKKLTETMNA